MTARTLQLDSLFCYHWVDTGGSPRGVSVVTNWRFVVEKRQATIAQEREQRRPLHTHKKKKKLKLARAYVLFAGLVDHVLQPVERIFSRGSAEARQGETRR